MGISLTLSIKGIVYSFFFDLDHKLCDLKLVRQSPPPFLLPSPLSTPLSLSVSLSTAPFKFFRDHNSNPFSGHGEVIV
jgi:hypothetical protein